MPTYKDFVAHVHQLDPGSDAPHRPYLAPGAKYPMTMVGSEMDMLDKLHVPSVGYDSKRIARNKMYELNVQQLYNMIRKLLARSESGSRDAKDAGSLASDIMGTLGYEWI